MMALELSEVIVRLADENRAWGCVQIQAELAKFGIPAWLGPCGVSSCPRSGTGGPGGPHLGRLPPGVAGRHPRR